MYFPLTLAAASAKCPNPHAGAATIRHALAQFQYFIQQPSCQITIRYVRPAKNAKRSPQVAFWCPLPAAT